MADSIESSPPPLSDTCAHTGTSFSCEIKTAQNTHPKNPNPANNTQGNTEIKPLSDTDNRLYTKIYDRIYDITDFIRKHPGGSVLRYVVNEDATEAYEGFHIRSRNVVSKHLKMIPSRPYNEETDSIKFNCCKKTEKLLQDFNKLRQNFEDRGLYKPSYIHVFIRVLEVAVMFVLHFFMLSQSVYHGWLYLCIGICIGGLAGGRAGWVQHEGGHGSLTGNNLIDKSIQKLGISFGLIVHNKKWNDMHNKHHATPQKVDHDPDVDTLPFVALYPEV